MTNHTPTPRPPAVSGTVLVVGIVTLFVFTIAGVVAVTIAVPEGGNPGSLITLMLGALTATIASLVTLAKVGQIGTQVDALANGYGDAKTRAAVADVLPAHLVDPAYRAEQSDVDLIRRSEGVHRR